MRECKSCGFPLKFIRFFDWRSDGSIVSTDRTRIKSRITFLEDGEMKSIFDKLAGVIGRPVDRILIEAEKNVGKEFFASTPLRFLKYAPQNRYLRPQFVAKLSVRLVRTDVAGLGSGVIKAESYRGGESMIMRISNPCFVPLMVGNTLGIYESVEKMKSAEYEHNIEDNGDLVIQMSHSDKPGRPLSESRLYLEEVIPGTGPLAYERCARCGTPVAAAGALQWNIERGAITNRFTGTRESVGAVQSIKAMVRELVDELGEEVLGILYEAQKEFTRRQLEDRSGEDPEKFWERYLFNLALRGLGYPHGFESDDRSVSVEIRTAYEQTLYAAKLAAALESITGLPSEIRWEKREPHSGAYLISVAAK